MLHVRACAAPAWECLLDASGRIADHVELRALDSDDAHEAIFAVVRDPGLARGILTLAVRLHERGVAHALQMAVLAHLFVGLMLQRHPRTRHMPAARFAHRALRWCASDAAIGYNPFSAAKRGVKGAARGIKRGAKAAARGIERGAKAAARGAERGVEEAGRLTRAGLRAALKPVIGERMTDLILNAAEMFVGTFKDFVFESLRGIVIAIRELVAGRPLKALEAVMGAVTMAFIGPALTSIAVLTNVPASRFRAFMKMVARKHQWLPLQFIGLVFTLPSLNPQTIALQTLSILRPVLADFLLIVEQAPESVVRGVDLGITILILIAANAGSIRSIVDTVTARAKIESQGQRDALEAKIRTAYTALERMNLAAFGRAFAEALRTTDLGRMAKTLTEREAAKARAEFNVQQRKLDEARAAAARAPTIAKEIEKRPAEAQAAYEKQIREDLAKLDARARNAAAQRAAGATESVERRAAEAQADLARQVQRRPRASLPANPFAAPAPA